MDEQLRGLLNLVKRARVANERIRHYKRLHSYLEDLTDWTILDWSAAADGQLSRLRAAQVRMSTMDLRIACIALAHNATLLTANIRDFGKVPELRVENWLGEPNTPENTP